MDRSRLLVTFAMVLSMVSVILGVMGIALSSRGEPFARPASDSFLTAGRSGVALIKIHGAITSGYSSGDTSGADDVIAELESAKNSSTIRAVMLDINSPGGSVGATKSIYNAIRDLRKVKPVVAVVSDIAASGGYYSASACDKIFAHEGSLVGSIGVISFHGDISGLLNNYNIKITAIKSGKFKDSSYPFRSMTDQERAMLQNVMDDAYEQFITDVSEGRGQPRKSVIDWAEGRIFSGKQAKSEQMIDEIGGRAEAIQTLKLILKTTDDLPIYEKKMDILERLLTSFPGASNGKFASSLTNSHVYYLYPSSMEILLKSMDLIVP